MTTLYIILGCITVVLFFYLLAAIVKPDLFP